MGKSSWRRYLEDRSQVGEDGAGYVRYLLAQLVARAGLNGQGVLVPLALFNLQLQPEVHVHNLHLALPLDPSRQVRLGEGLAVQNLEGKGRR